MSINFSIYERKTVIVGLSHYRNWLFNNYINCENAVYPEMRDVANKFKKELTLVDDALQKIINENVYINPMT
jgi:hypothetical protein